MEQAGKATGVDKPADGVARSGQSGEGARSALEHLIRQERSRDAQRPQEAGPPKAGERPPGSPVAP